MLPCCRTTRGQVAEKTAEEGARQDLNSGPCDVRACVLAGLVAEALLGGPIQPLPCALWRKEQGGPVTQPLGDHSVNPSSQCPQRSALGLALAQVSERGAVESLSGQVSVVPSVLWAPNSLTRSEDSAKCWMSKLWVATFQKAHKCFRPLRCLPGLILRLMSSELASPCSAQLRGWMCWGLGPGSGQPQPLCGRGCRKGGREGQWGSVAGNCSESGLPKALTSCLLSS